MKLLMIGVQSIAFLVATCGAGWAAAPAPAFSAVLTYPPASRSTTVAPVYRHAGRAYRFRLEPERDVSGHVVMVEIMLQPADAPPDSNVNLLDPRHLFGLQKWTLAAPEFAHGPDKSVYGNVRTVKVARLGTAVTIIVERAGVARTAATPSLPAGVRFTNLTVRVTLPATPSPTSRRPRPSGLGSG